MATAALASLHSRFGESQWRALQEIGKIRLFPRGAPSWVHLTRVAGLLQQKARPTKRWQTRLEYLAIPAPLPKNGALPHQDTPNGPTSCPELKARRTGCSLSRTAQKAAPKQPRGGRKPLCTMLHSTLARSSSTHTSHNAAHMLATTSSSLTSAGFLSDRRSVARSSPESARLVSHAAALYDHRRRAKGCGLSHTMLQLRPAGGRKCAACRTQCCSCGLLAAESCGLLAAESARPGSHDAAVAACLPSDVITVAWHAAALPSSAAGDVVAAACGRRPASSPRALT